MHNLIIQHNCTKNARCNKWNYLLLNDKKYKLENRRKDKHLSRKNISQMGCCIKIFKNIREIQGLYNTFEKI